MERHLYIEIDTLCIFLLIFIRYCLKHNIDQQQINLNFKRVVSVLTCILTIDTVWMLIDGHPGQFMRAVSILLNAAYMCLCGFVGYLWLRFVEAKLKSPLIHSYAVRALLMLPLLALLLCAAATPFTGWLFTIDEFNVYRRGPLYLMQVFCTYFYMLSSVPLILYAVKNESTRQKRREALGLLWFVILPAIGGIISVSTFGLPTVWPFAALSALMVYVNFTSYQISTDGLTGLNNRRRFDAQLHSLVSDAHRAPTVCLIMIDVDCFKQINDTYGHSEGDRALVETAELLKAICSGHEMFLCRYGGDEFAIISSDVEYNEQQLTDEINSVFAAHNSTGHRSYPLTLSIGAARLSDISQCTDEALVYAADMALYSQKRAKSRKR